MQQFQAEVDAFTHSLEEESAKAGMPLKCVQKKLVAGNQNEIRATMNLYKEKGVRFVLVPLTYDCYNMIKICGDSAPITTQCVKIANIRKNQVKTVSNIVLKINAKLGVSVFV